MKRFEKQVAVITGGANGIGYGVAERIASEGGSVALFDVDEDQLKRSVDTLTSKGYTALGLKVDISEEDQVKNSLQQVFEKWRRLDIMVNSAGIVGPTNTPITAYPVDAYDKVYRVNLRGAFLMTKYSIRLMEMNNYGRILLVASIAGKEGNPFMTGYSSMKAGVLGLVKGIGKEYAKTGITINGLAPAVIRTGINDNTAPEQLAYMTSRIPMGRLGEVDEVASLISWIVSKEASFNTACVFDISVGRATY